jgi:hypothetical protein
MIALRGNRARCQHHRGRGCDLIGDGLCRSTKFDGFPFDPLGQFSRFFGFEDSAAADFDSGDADIDVGVRGWCQEGGWRREEQGVLQGWEGRGRGRGKETVGECRSGGVGVGNRH